MDVTTLAPAWRRALQAGDAVHVQRGGDEPVGHGQPHGGDREQLVGVAGRQHVGQRRARLRHEGHDAHLLPAGLAHGDDGAGAVGRRVADAGEQAVLDEQAGAPGRAARGGARRERLPHAQALVELRRVGLLVQRVPVGAAALSSRSDASGTHAGRDHDRAARLAARTARHELEQRRVAGLVVDDAGPRPSSGRAGRRPKPARSRQMATTSSSGLAVARALVVVRRGRSRTRTRCGSRSRSRRSRRGRRRRRSAARAARARRRTPAAPRRRRAAAPRGRARPASAPPRMRAQRHRATGERPGAAHGRVTGTRGRRSTGRRSRRGPGRRRAACADGAPSADERPAAAPRRAAPRWPGAASTGAVIQQEP